MANTHSLERVSLNSDEIVKVGSVSPERFTYPDADYKIEIISIEKIEKGVQVLARAWMPNGKQIGFGRDGSVDIERFRIFNPSIMVQDPLGDIEITTVNPPTVAEAFRGEGEQIEVLHYRKDPKAAIMRTLCVVLNAKKQTFTDTKITEGLIGSTSSTFISVAGSNSPMDASVQNQDESVWSTCRDATAGDESNTIQPKSNVYVGQFSSNYYIGRAFLLFDTSAITDTDTLDSATLTLTAEGLVEDYDNDAYAYQAIYQATPAANDAIVNGDFDQISRTIFSNKIDIGTWDGTDGNTNVYTLTTAGKAEIDFAGISKFSIQLGHDAENHVYNSGGSNENSARFYMADQGSNQPLLTVEHSVAAATFTQKAIIF